MFSTAHLTSGIALGLALGLEGWPLVAVAGASVLTDWDYAFQLLTGKNHRHFLTHSPPVYLAMLGPLGFAWPLAWWLLLGSMLHFALDVWEYGIRLNPFQNRIYGFRLLRGVETMRFPDYLRTYFGDRRFLAAEVGFALIAGSLAMLRFL